MPNLLISPVCDRFARALLILIPPLAMVGPALSDGALILIGVLFLLRSAHAKDASWFRVRWFQLALGLWAFMCLRDAFIGDTGAWERSLGFVRLPLFAVALQHWLLTDAATRKRLLISVGATVGFVAFDTLVQYVHGTDLFGRKPVDFHGAALSRLTGPLSKPRIGVSMLWLMFPPVLAAMSAPDMRVRSLGFFGAALVVGAIYVSGERMALLLTLTGFALAFVLLPTLRKWLALAGALALALMLALNATDTLLVQRQVQHSYDEIAHFWESPYGQTWMSAMKVGKAHPLIGVGAKQFRTECRKPEYGATDALALIYRCPMHTHNIYLEKLVEHGAIGLTLFLVLIWCWASNVWRAWPRWKYDPVITGLVVTLAVRLWPINAQTSQFPAASSVPFWLFVGWLMTMLALRDAKR